MRNLNYLQAMILTGKRMWILKKESTIDALLPESI